MSEPLDTTPCRRPSASSTNGTFARPRGRTGGTTSAVLRSSYAGSRGGASVGGTDTHPPRLLDRPGHFYRMGATVPAPRHHMITTQWEPSMPSGGHRPPDGGRTMNIDMSTLSGVADPAALPGQQRGLEPGPGAEQAHRLGHRLLDRPPAHPHGPGDRLVLQPGGHQQQHPAGPVVEVGGRVPGPQPRDGPRPDVVEQRGPRGEPRRR